VKARARHEPQRASGRDDESVETTDPLILGGTIGVIGGPLLAAWSARELGLHGALPVISMSNFPVGVWHRCDPYRLEAAPPES